MLHALEQNEENKAVLKPMMKMVKQMSECGEEELEEAANMILMGVGGDAELMGDDLESTMGKFLRGDNNRFGSGSYYCY